MSVHWTYDDCPYEAWTNVIVLWEVVSQCIFIDVVSLRVNCDVSVSVGVHGLLHMLVADIPQAIGFAFHAEDIVAVQVSLTDSIALKSTRGSSFEALARRYLMRGQAAQGVVTLRDRWNEQRVSRRIGPLSKLCESRRKGLFFPLVEELSRLPCSAVPHRGSGHYSG